MQPVWRESFRVRFYDADPRGRATLPALCRFLQVTADRHVRDTGASLSELQAAGRMWVLTELTLAVDRLPSIEDELCVETWGARRMGGARAYRDFLLLDARGRRFGAAASLWLYLDSATRRPLRLPDQIMAFRVADRDQVLPDVAPLSAPKAAGAEIAFRVGWQDLDQNRHANNVRYLEWALGAVPLEAWDMYQVNALTIRFQSEVILGEVVHSGVELVELNSGDLEMRHRIRSDPDRTVALARTSWRRCRAGTGG